MKITTKFFISSSIVGLLIGATQRGFAQHYANLTPESNNNPIKVKKAIVSFGFFSPLNHHISFGFDKLVGTNLILSTQAGIIGPGITQNSNSSGGGFIEAGPKLFFSPDWLMDGMHRYNAMQGGYFKPEIAISVFSQADQTYSYTNYNYTSQTNNQTYTGLALILNFGKQWIFANSFALDMYVGVGYSLSSLTSGSNVPNNASETPTNYFCYLTSGSGFPLAFSAGINLGVPF